MALLYPLTQKLKRHVQLDESIGIRDVSQSIKDLHQVCLNAFSPLTKRGKKDGHNGIPWNSVRKAFDSHGETGQGRDKMRSDLMANAFWSWRIQERQSFFYCNVCIQRAFINI